MEPKKQPNNENWLTKQAKLTYDSFMHPFPGCPYCNQRERTLTLVRIIFLIGLLLVGNKLIDYVSHDIESQCCQVVAMARGHGNVTVLSDREYENIRRLTPNGR